MTKIQAFVFCFLFCSLTLNGILCGSSDGGYDEKLSKFIIEIIDNSRDYMSEGIPDIGVPPTDPLSVPNIDQDIEDFVVRMTMRLRHNNMTGLSKFQTDMLKVDLEGKTADFSFSVPEIAAESHCFMDGKILGVFPLNADGPLIMNAKEVKIEGRGLLNVTTESESTRVRLSDLGLDMKHGSLEVDFGNLLIGGTIKELLLKDLREKLGPHLFERFQKETLTQINEGLMNLVNSELDKGTLSELLN